MVTRYKIQASDELWAEVNNCQNQEQQDQLKKYLLDKFKDPQNIALFAYFVLPNYFYRAFKQVHYKALDFLEIGQRNKPHKALKAYRGFGKSSMVIVLENIYEICHNIHPYIIFNSYNESMSIDKIKLIRDEFESNDVIKWLYGDPVTKADSWNKSDLTIYKTRVKTISTGQNPRGLLDRGNRPSKIVSDDILDDQDVRSETMRVNALDWYKDALTPALASDGVMEIINTPMHPEDIIQTIFKDPPAVPFQKWGKLKISAIDELGESVDPDWKSTQELDDLAQDEYNFSQEYECEPILITSGLVKFEWLRFWYEPGLYKGEVRTEYKAGLPKLKTGYIHLDTTHTGKQTSDYFCLNHTCEGDDSNFYLVDFILEKLDVETQARRTIAYYLQAKASGLPIDKLTYDEKANQGFGYWIKKLAKEEYNLSLPIEELKYPNDKLAHFQPHLPHFIANRYYLPLHHKSIKIGQDQLLAFPQNGVHDDFIDGISGVLDNFKEVKRTEYKPTVFIRKPSFNRL